MQNCVEEIIKTKRAVVFGAGTGLEKWFRLFNAGKFGLEVMYLCDNDSTKWNSVNKTLGISISSPDVLATLSTEEFFVVVVSVYEKEITEQIRKLNPDLTVFSQGDISRTIYKWELDSLTDCYKIDYAKRVNEWLDSAFEDEVGYWDSRLKDARERKDVRLTRREFSYPYAAMEVGPDTKILDVGSGPMAKFGNEIQGYRIQYIPVDPLAYQYKEIIEKHHLDLPVMPQFAIMENLSLFYGENTMDYIIVNNAMDHSIDLVRGLVEMMQVVKVGGMLCTWHMECEAVLKKYQGLHSWNIYKSQTGDLIIGDMEKNRVNVSKLFAEFAEVDISKCTEGNCKGYITANIRKIKEVPQNLIDQYANKTAGGTLIGLLFEHLYKNK